ncbi:MAG: glycosyltransferase family 2 protein [Muribaculaceae bacterium]|nr:glycosyltransferase family 2 protein [Muribaculaceae bacterium]
MIKTSEDKLITVVIPVYNRGELVCRTLNSVAQQNPEMFNLVLVDNNSTDNTAHVLRQWIEANPEIDAMLLSESCQCASAARNRGLEAVATPWVLFFDSDDIMLPGHIAKAVDAVRSQPDADIIGWDVEIMLSDGSRRLMRFPVKDLMKNHLVHGILSTQRFMAKTELVRRVGGWDCDLKKWDDFELGVRLLAAHPKVAYRQGVPLVKVIFTRESITGMNFASGAGEWEKSLDRIESILEKSAPEMSDWVAYRRADLAAAYSREGAGEHVAPLLTHAKERARRKYLVSVVYNLKRVIPRGVWHVADLLIRK